MEEEGYEPPPKVKEYIEDKDCALKEIWMKRCDDFLADIKLKEKLRAQEKKERCAKKKCDEAE